MRLRISVSRAVDLTGIERRIAEHPNDADALVELGSALHGQGRSAEAVAALEKAVALRPDHSAAVYNLGCAQLSLRQYGAAAETLQRARKLQPDWYDVHHNLGVALQELGRSREAAECFSRAIALNAGFAPAHNSLGTALQAINQNDRAAAAFQQALAINPGYAEAHYNWGNLLAEEGRLDEARSHYERAIQLEPRQAAFHQRLAHVARFVDGDARLPGLAALAQQSAALDESGRMHLHFALGKAFDDLGHPGDSFGNFLAGNAFKRGMLEYDERTTLEVFPKTRSVFTAALLREKAGLGNPSDVPIFIIGMPRSGTSLLEQVLASHPDVHGAGELLEFETAARGVSADSAGPSLSAAAVAALGPAELQRIGSAYLKAVRALAPRAQRITDKLPANFLNAGLIRLALPNAKIIHVQRDPVDTCLSCFYQLFTGSHLPYSYELRELGRYYRAYEALMGHWREVLEPGAMLEVRYEDFVADLEAQARRMLEYCGLPWNDACLSFHDTRRTVKTASMVAVRRPIYKSAVGRSNAVREFLGPLLEELVGR